MCDSTACDDFFGVNGWAWVGNLFTILVDYNYSCLIERKTLWEENTIIFYEWVDEKPPICRRKITLVVCDPCEFVLHL